MVIDLSYGSRIATSMISRMLLNVCKAASAASYPIISTREEAFMNDLSSRFGTVSCRPAETLHECVSRPIHVEPCITLKQCSFGPRHSEMRRGQLRCWHYARASRVSSDRPQHAVSVEQGTCRQQPSNVTVRAVCHTYQRPHAIGS